MVREKEATSVAIFTGLVPLLRSVPATASNWRTDLKFYVLPPPRRPLPPVFVK